MSLLHKCQISDIYNLNTLTSSPSISLYSLPNLALDTAVVTIIKIISMATATATIPNKYMSLTSCEITKIISFIRKYIASHKLTNLECGLK